MNEGKQKGNLCRTRSYSSNELAEARVGVAVNNAPRGISTAGI